jgi:hypothetical protein
MMLFNRRIVVTVFLLCQSGQSEQVSGSGTFRQSQRHCYSNALRFIMCHKGNAGSRVI